MKQAGERIGDVFRVIGLASVRIRSITRYDWSRFVEEGKRFVRVRGWPQNPPIIDHRGSTPLSGTPSTATTYSDALSRPPRFNPSSTGNLSGNSARDRIPTYLQFTAWSWFA